MKSNVAAAKAKVEEIARGIDIGEKGTLGDLLFGPDQVTKENLFFSTLVKLSPSKATPVTIVNIVLSVTGSSKESSRRGSRKEGSC